MLNEVETANRKRENGVPITFRATPEFARRVEQGAARELISVSAFVRRAVLQSLNLMDGQPINRIRRV